MRGSGRVPDRQKVSVEVPAGIRDGQQMRVSGFGEAGMQGAAAGDLIVTVRIQPHEFYERDGDDLHVRITIPMVQAALGAEIGSRASSEDERFRPHPRGDPKARSFAFETSACPGFAAMRAATCTYTSTSERFPAVSKKEREILEELAEEMGEEVSDKRSPLQSSATSSISEQRVPA